MERQPCLFCDKTYLNGDTVTAHCARDHDPRLNSSSAIWGHRCPACGESFARLSQHCSMAHGRQVALLFADSRRADPHGVVADRLAYFAGLIQEQLVNLLRRPVP